MLVGHEDIVERDRRALEGLHDVGNAAARIDERGVPLLLEDDEIAVARMRFVDLMSDVIGQRLFLWPPARKSDVRESPWVKTQRLAQGARLVFGRRSSVARELLDPRCINAGLRRELFERNIFRARRLAHDVAERIFEVKLDDHEPPSFPMRL